MLSWRVKPTLHHGEAMLYPFGCDRSTVILYAVKHAHRKHTIARSMIAKTTSRLRRSRNGCSKFVVSQSITRFKTSRHCTWHIVLAAPFCVSTSTYICLATVVWSTHSRRPLWRAYPHLAGTDHLTVHRGATEDWIL
jgi:hypothetical protein